MKIINLKTQIIYDINADKPNENAMPCPACSKTRKHERAKSFSWNNSKLTGYCQNCESKFVEFKALREEVKYSMPVWNNKTDLSDKAIRYFEGRMINQTTLTEMQIYTATEWMPQFNKEIDVICFPFFYRDKVLNIKYRGAEKSFKLFKDAELIFYNLNCLNEFKDIVITEGEIDMLSFHTVGIKNCISVPNGANKNVSYLDNYIELFDDKRIILATDNDLVGLSLRNELIRRFGSENCSIIDFKDCKDANEYLIKYGSLALQDAYKNAESIPVDGIIELDQKYDDIYALYLNGMQKGKCIEDDLDKLISWESGRIATWTGIPSHGKSEVVDWLNVRMNINNGDKVAYFSPENYPVQYHYSKLCSKISGVPFNAMNLNKDEFDLVFDYVKNNFYFIYPEENFTLESILERAKFLVKKVGIKTLVLDPYNKFDHKKERGESETDYVSRFMDQLSNFAKKYSLLIHLVAHPTKIKKDSTGIKFEVPTLYDISGSANFYNKTDFGITVYRDKSEDDPHVQIHIQKVKFRHLGLGGMIQKQYNSNNGRLENYGTNVNDWSHLNYLKGSKIENNFIMPTGTEFEHAPY